MFFFFIFFSFSFFLNETDEIEFLTEIAKKYKLKIDSNKEENNGFVQILNNFADFTEFVNEIKTEFPYVVFSDQQLKGKYVIGQNFESFPNFQTIANFQQYNKNERFRFNSKIFAIELSIFVLIILFLANFTSFVKSPLPKIIRYISDTFIFDSNRKILTKLPQIDFDIHQYIVLNDEAVYNEIQYFLENNSIYKFFSMPITKRIYLGLAAHCFLFDVDTHVQSSIASGEMESDEFDHREKVDVLHISTHEVRINANKETSIMLYSEEMTNPMSSFYYSYCNNDLVIWTLIKDLLLRSPTLDSFLLSIEDIKHRTTFDSIGFFTESQAGVETIKFICDDPKLIQINKQFMQLLKPKDFRKTASVYNKNGVRCYGTKHQIGTINYYFIVALKEEYPILFGIEDSISILSLYLSLFYHVNISSFEGSRAITRLYNIVHATQCFNLYEIDDYDNLKHVISNIPFTDEIRDMIDETPDLKKTPTQFKAENGKVYGIIAQTTFDEVKQQNLRTCLLEDISIFTDSLEQFKEEHKSEACAASFFKFHRLLNDMHLLDDELSTELGYNKKISNLIELVYHDDIDLLRTIRKEGITAIRLATENGECKWYLIIFPDAPSGNGSNVNGISHQNSTGNNYTLTITNTSSHSFNIKDPQNTGIIFSIDDFIAYKNMMDDDIQDSLFNVDADVFAVYTVDLKTGNIINSICHRGFIQTDMQDIYWNAHDDYRNLIKSTFEQFQKGTLTYSKLIVKCLNLKVTYGWYEMTFEKLDQSQSIIILMLDIDAEKILKDNLIEAKSLVDLALFHSNVVHWEFENDTEKELIFTSKPLTYEPLVFNWTSLIHNVSSDCLEHVKEVFDKAIQTGEPFEVELSIIFDKMRWILIRGQMNENTNQLFGVYFDLTELRENELLLDQQKQKALEASQAKSNFLANLTHEIRTPMNGMFSMLELLMSANMTPDQLEMMKVVKSSFNKLLELLNDTLDIAKIDQNRMKPEMIIFNPYEFIEPTISELFRSRANSDTKLIIDSPSDLPLLFYGDPHFLMRITHNLMSNAIKFTERGSITVKIRYKTRNYLVENDKDYLIIAIKDTGIGIPKSKQEAIFETFTQGDSSITRPYGGSGVGLSLIVKLLSLIGGKIELNSVQYQGSEFTCTFPYDIIQAPYFPRPLYDLPIQCLNLSSSQKNNVIFEFAVFYGITLISSKDEIDEENLKIVIVDNNDEDIDYIKELRKKNKSIQPVIFNPPQDAKFPPQYMKLLDPIVPSVIKNLFVSVKLKKSELVQQSKQLPYVLVADDNETNRVVMDLVLNKIGCRHKLVEDGSETIPALDAEKFDLILMDQNMPKMDGPTATRAIRNSNKPWANIPIIAMTASTMNEDKKICLDAGMNAFVTKPISQEALKKVLLSYSKK